MKKTLAFFVLAALLGSNISAQEAHKNTIYFGSAGFIGIAAGYERMLLPNFSLTADAGLGLSIAGSAYATVGARWYPASKGFFLSTRFGYGAIIILEDTNDNESEQDGVLLSPGIGFKIGKNKPKGFIFCPGLDLDIVIGKRTTHYLYDEKTEFDVGFNPVLKVLFGIAF